MVKIPHHAPNAGGPGSIPGLGARCHMLQLKILHAANLRLGPVKEVEKKERKKRKKEMLNNG